MVIETNLDLCVWKLIALEDQKKVEGMPITLSFDKKCHSCYGVDLECKQYQVSKFKKEPVNYNSNIIVEAYQ